MTYFSCLLVTSVLQEMLRPPGTGFSTSIMGEDGPGNYKSSRKFQVNNTFPTKLCQKLCCLLKTDRKYPVKPFEVKTLENKSQKINKITVASNMRCMLYIKTLTGGLVHQVVLVGVDVVADGGHHHAVVPARLELVETEAGVLHQDTPAVPVESLQLVVSDLNNAWCQHSALSRCPGN